MGKRIASMKVPGLETYKDELNEQINEVSEKYFVLQDKLMGLNKEKKKVEEALDERTLKEDDIEELIKNYPETKDRREKFGKYIRSLYLSDAGSYWIDTNQRVVKIMLWRDDDEHTKRVHDGILKVLPFIKKREQGYEEGLKVFDLFEHTLSYHYSYHFAYNEEKKTFSVRTHHRNDIRIEDEDLMKVLKYTQENHYYEKGMCPEGMFNY